jgi:mannose-6-phosphate isomerase-like protein (cupin superfamily)
LRLVKKIGGMMKNNIMPAILVVSFSLFPLTCVSQNIEIGDNSNLTETVKEDHGPEPWTADIEEITLSNPHFRVAKWTGTDIQMTLMSIPVGGEIGGEKHPSNDQFVRIESGSGRVLMGESEDDITFDEKVSDDWVFFIPAGYWHNLYNTGDTELKLYSIYGPPEHPHGTVHKTFEESEEAHHD